MITGLLVSMFASGLLAVVLLVGCGGGGGLSDGTPTPYAFSPGPMKTLRWLNVTVTVPAGWEVRLVDPSRFDDQSRAILWYSAFPGEANHSQVVLNALTGSVIDEFVQPEHEDAIGALLRSLEVGEPVPGSLPWPVGESQPDDLPRGHWGYLSYPIPSSATGLAVDPCIAECFCVEPRADAGEITLWNGRSEAIICYKTESQTIEFHGENVLPEDIASFERYFAGVTICQPNGSC